MTTVNLSELSHNPDAAKWAEAFKQTFPAQPLAEDEGLMLGWFANAMMAMHDYLLFTPEGLAKAESALRERGAK